MPHAFVPHTFVFVKIRSMVSLLNCHAAPHITSSTFGSTVFGRAAISDEHRGSRIAPYATTAEVDGASFEQPAGS